jgi:hypothetical protein
LNLNIYKISKKIQIIKVKRNKKKHKRKTKGKGKETKKTQNETKIAYLGSPRPPGVPCAICTRRNCNQKSCLRKKIAFPALGRECIKPILSGAPIRRLHRRDPRRLNG